MTMMPSFGPNLTLERYKGEAKEKRRKRRGGRGGRGGREKVRREKGGGGEGRDGKAVCVRACVHVSVNVLVRACMRGRACETRERAKAREI
jgi:hypothetical protein